MEEYDQDEWKKILKSYAELEASEKDENDGLDSAEEAEEKEDEEGGDEEERWRWFLLPGGSIFSSSSLK